MAGINDKVAMIGDWVPPSPSPRAFFSAILGEDISSRTISEHLENRSEGLFLGSQEQITGGDGNKRDLPESGGAQLPQLNSPSEAKSSSRGVLVERMVARAGFNAPRLNTERIRTADLSLDPESLSPYLTIPTGLSPTALLDSPVFVSNSLAQPSPTTRKFSFLPNGNSKISSLVSEIPDKSKDNFFDDINASSLAFKPVADPGSSFVLGATSRIAPATVPQFSFPSIQVSVRPEKSHVAEEAKLHSQDRNPLNFQAEQSRPTAGKDIGHNSNTIDRFNTAGGSHGLSPIHDEQKDEEGDQRASGDSMNASGGSGTPSEDGYYWRKYGQKQVKGSEYPRSYYKCTHPTCPVKKKVEHSHEGHITEIIYKGAHDHPKPPSNRGSAIGSSNLLMDMQMDVPEQGETQRGADNDLLWTNTHKGTAIGTLNWWHDNVEVTSSTSAGPEFGNPSSLVQAQTGNYLESGSVEASSTFSNSEDEDDRATHGSVGNDGVGDESESKRRKIESYATEMSGATRAIREPRVVVQTTSEVDILDDGYRWRKYGQKVVKGNPNPRSYYKCTNAGCAVRKHVERASHDIKSVITTYEGKHNHDVPATRNSSHVNSSTCNAMPAQGATAVQNHVQRREPSQIHNSMTRFEGSTPFGSFSLPGRQQLASGPSFSFGMNQAASLANLAMAGLGPDHAKNPVLPINHYVAHQSPVNEMGFMLPKGEPKMEPLSETNLNLTQNPSMYQQIMSRLPHGPHT